MRRVVLSLWLVCLFGSPGWAAEAVEVVPVAGHVSMLVGKGGNIGVSAGDDGVMLIDDQFAPASDAIRKAVASLGEGAIRFVLNTHWHQDHTGGNESFGKGGALIVAHENVRRRMNVDQVVPAFGRTVPAAPEAALPVVTYQQSVTFHWNGDEIHAFHVDPAHTDGDSIVHFRKANVLHMGDTFFHRMYPFIDGSSGGSVEGMIAAVDRGLRLADDETRIIPGHGPLATKNDLRSYRAMLVEVRTRIRAAIGEGKNVDEVVAAKPTADFDARFSEGFLTPERFVRLVYDLLHGADAGSQNQDGSR